MMARAVSGFPIVVGSVTVIVASLFAGSHLARNEMNPTFFTAFGARDTAILDYANARLPEVLVRPELGHDGRFFFVQANDPWLTRPSKNAELLDRPVYRSQRMMYPLIAGLGGLLAPQGVVWGMVVVNVGAMGLGAWACANLVVRHGRSAWLGLAFPLNIGLMSEFSIGGAGIVALAFAFCGLVALESGHPWAAGLLLAGATLSREVMFLVVIGLALWLIRSKRTDEIVGVAAPPLILTAAWALYVRIVLPSEQSATSGNFDWPLVGLSSSLERWLADPVDLVVGATLVLVLAYYLLKAIRAPSITSYAFVFFVPLAFVLSEKVWAGYFNISRAVAPVLTAFLLITLFVEDDDSVSQGRIEIPSKVSRGSANALEV